ncbi:MAG TPA: maleylpyruvate isomerase family mycothiol-dependent enzyme [Acidimicrobiales bacterium]|jgi:hypothetical protein|nr:maleylpyruvate isomerase family mycothiol-dependent enzyme [Acidimicrobiales bacterium]
MSEGAFLPGERRRNPITNRDVWTVVHAERQALAADLAGLDDDRWATPSLCSAWSVRDVLAHMTATAKNTPTAFLGKKIGSGFRLTGA